MCVHYNEGTSNRGYNKTRAVDPHSFYADPDPAVFLDADPDLAVFLNADPDPDPDPGPGPAKPNLKKKNHEEFS